MLDVAEEPRRGHAGDGAKLADEVRLVEVAGLAGDGRPARTGAAELDRAANAQDRCELLRRPADDAAEALLERLARAWLETDRLGFLQAVGAVPYDPAFGPPAPTK
ncbi:MAG TPA: hypothetical protein VGD80_35300 [Kofleriaceae bacterium]